MKEVNIYPYYNHKLRQYSIYTGWVVASRSLISTYNHTYILLGDAWDEVFRTSIANEITLNSFL